ncbi:ketopantoate reductase family protein [Spirochaeta isovalerica]|uniref:2-dehydropantoate 2-reductase n=1 Tax=Spirochaeta isovalerica TaxID=150 RepID=A0A841RFK3_9SPIO|nr:2-dehydropantoate 2-reductase N-terminal domain-containing protein [Spirochaeta isovalerica]MBB6481589.1 2-dehydropantoate 2-reductase [Spirochaeta isovalerica]
MRILIIGAGVTGSLFASYLASSREKLERKLKENFELKILARNDTHKRLSENGLKIHHVVQNVTTIDSIPVIKTLESGDIYDYVFVFLRKTQIAPLMEDLRSNRSDHFIFAGNNGTGLDGLCPPLKVQKVSLAFAGVGGKREGDTVYSVHGKKPGITIGVNKKTARKIRKLGKIFTWAGCSLRKTNRMDAWLKHHLALVVPLSLALYRDGGDNVSLSENGDLLQKSLKAAKEGSAALRRQGHPVAPGKLKLTLLMPCVFLKSRVKKLLASPIGKLLIYDHCMTAREEMRELAGELQALVAPDDKPRENLEELLTQNN